jgi:sugar-specific transcriptional regulator TrmB
MNASENREEAIELLQQLGLKEYEARCFVGLSRIDTGTAKRLSEMTEVPRTRVYDAIRVLEAQGLVEVQHSSPQRFRAVPLDQATQTIQNQYESRIERLETAIDKVDGAEEEDETPVQQVWSMAGQKAIMNRTNSLIEEANDEIVLVLGDESLLTPNIAETLNDVDNGTELLVGALTRSLEKRVQQMVPNATTFVSGLEWLHGEEPMEDETAIGRLLLVDRSTILVSSLLPATDEEKAIFGEGFGNGLVVIARRLMAQGLLIQRDPAH